MTRQLSGDDLPQHTDLIKTSVVIVLGLLLLLPHALTAFYTPGDALDGPERRFFEETGFWVSGDFLAYFDEHGGLEIFGYPISSQYNDQGVMVQYFQNARMELPPFSSDSGGIELGRLAEELHLGRASSAPSSETGHAVHPIFLRYFRAHGGAEFFGDPITPMLNQNQKAVQYFQCFQLIWDHVTTEITVGNLGEVYVNAHRNTIPADVLKPLSALSAFRTEPGLSVILGLGHPVAKQDEGQVVVVIVRDDYLGDPVSDARVRLTLRDDTGRSLPVPLDTLTSDQNGRIETAIPLDTLTPGSWVLVQAEASWGAQVAADQAIFLVWW